MSIILVCEIEIELPTKYLGQKLVNAAQQLSRTFSSLSEPGRTLELMNFASGGPCLQVVH